MFPEVKTVKEHIYVCLVKIEEGIGFCLAKMPAYQLGCSGAVGGATDHAFLSGYNAG